MVKNILVIILSVLATIACADSSFENNRETVSLLDYVSKKELDDRKLTQEKLKELEAYHIDKVGYPRYQGYEKQKLNNFEVIVNPNNPNELYVVKDGNFLLVIYEDSVRLYHENTKFPNPADTAVAFNYKTPSVYIVGKEKVYYDRNLDGLDKIYKIKPNIGKYEVMNSVDIHDVLPKSELVYAVINNQQCKAINQLACCETEESKYIPYWNEGNGWIKENSKSRYQYCNSKKFIEETSKR